MSKISLHFENEATRSWDCENAMHPEVSKPRNLEIPCPFTMQFNFDHLLT